MKHLIQWSLALPLLGASLTAPVLADEPPCPFYENRSGLCGYYASEISPAAAFLDTVVKRGKRGKWGKPNAPPDPRRAQHP